MLGYALEFSFQIIQRRTGFLVQRDIPALVAIAKEDDFDC